MKKILKAVCFLLVLITFAFWDSFVFKNIRLTLALLICCSLYFRDAKVIYIFSFTGLLCDLICKTLPCFSFLYLYISIGCVWCEKMFLNIGAKTVLLVSFLGFLAFSISTQLINMLAFYQVSVSLTFFLKSTGFALINSSISLIIYFLLRGLKFENHKK